MQIGYLSGRENYITHCYETFETEDTYTAKKFAMTDSKSFQNELVKLFNYRTVGKEVASICASQQYIKLHSHV